MALAGLDPQTKGRTIGLDGGFSRKPRLSRKVLPNWYECRKGIQCVAENDMCSVCHVFFGKCKFVWLLHLVFKNDCYSGICLTLDYCARVEQCSKASAIPIC